MAVIGIDEDTIMLNGSHKDAYQFEADAAERFKDVVSANMRGDVPGALRALEKIMLDVGVRGIVGFADDVARHYGNCSNG